MIIKILEKIEYRLTRATERIQELECWIESWPGTVRKIQIRLGIIPYTTVMYERDRINALFNELCSVRLPYTTVTKKVDGEPITFRRYGRIPLNTILVESTGDIKKDIEQMEKALDKRRRRVRSKSK